jgi:hypothetical protein
MSEDRIVSRQKLADWFQSLNEAIDQAMKWKAERDEARAVATRPRPRGKCND